MIGTVAVGNALVGAPITVIDANGKTATTTSGTNGAYSVSIAGLTAPFAITATDPSGASGGLYSIVVSATTANGAPVTANVTPLTTAVSALLTAGGNPLTLTQAGGLSGITSSSVAAAVSTLNSALAPILTANGLSAASFDPIGGAFTPNQSGADAVIDAVSVRPAMAGGGLQISSLADPNTSVPLHQGASAAATLQTPPQRADYLAPLLASLAQCMAGPADGSDPACATAIDANYLSNGFNKFWNRLPLVGQGQVDQTQSLIFVGEHATLTGAKTVAFLPKGTIPGINNPAALVYLLYKQRDGMPNFASEIVQQLPNGTWDIIGNQEQYNITIASFLGRVQYTDAIDANNGHFESGLNIQIPLTANSSTQVLGSALVTGPGLPAFGEYLVSAMNGGGLHGTQTMLTFPLETMNAPASSAPGNAWPDVGITTQYKWSWSLFSGGNGIRKPSTPDYASSPVDVSTIQPYGSYTVKLYDTEGQQIGKSQTVLNVGPNLDATAGATVPWQTLGGDVIAKLLTPGGAGTSTTTTGVPPGGIDWTVPSTNVTYPNGSLSINAQVPAGADVLWAEPNISTAIFNDEYVAPPQPWVFPQIRGTTYAAYGLGYIDQLTPDMGFYTSVMQVQLGWQADGEVYTNTWQYNK